MTVDCHLPHIHYQITDGVHCYAVLLKFCLYSMSEKSVLFV